jgi:hypothetical protein
MHSFTRALVNGSNISLFASCVGYGSNLGGVVGRGITSFYEVISAFVNQDLADRVQQFLLSVGVHKSLIALADCLKSAVEAAEFVVRALHVFDVCASSEPLDDVACVVAQGHPPG